MYIIADFSISLDIDDCVGFCQDKSANVLAEIRKRYDGMCYSGVKILRAVSIVRMGECVFTSQLSATTGSLCATFRAIVVAIYPGDLLPACARVTKVGATDAHAGPIIFRGEHVVVANNQATMRAIVQEGAIVPMVASAVSANVPCECLSVVGSFYEPSRVTLFYPFTGTSHLSEVLSERKYIKIQDIRAGNMDDAAPSSIIDATLAALDDLNSINSKYSNDIKKIVASLFYIEGKPSDSLLIIPISARMEIPSNVTCLVANYGANPFDGKIAFSSARIEELPETWKQGAIAQPASLVIRRYLEQVMSFAITGAELTRAYGNTEILKKAQTFVAYVQQIIAKPM